MSRAVEAPVMDMSASKDLYLASHSVGINQGTVDGSFDLEVQGAHQSEGGSSQEGMPAGEKIDCTRLISAVLREPAIFCSKNILLKYISAIAISCIRNEHSQIFRLRRFFCALPLKKLLSNFSREVPCR